MMNGEFELWVRVRWERGTRYYEAYVHQDLWGAWVLTRSWGRRRTRLGRTVHLVHPTWTRGISWPHSIGRGNSGAIPPCRWYPSLILLM